MSDASSSIMFMPVNRPSSFVRHQVNASQSVSRAESESVEFAEFADEAASSVDRPHFINPVHVSGAQQQSYVPRQSPHHQSPTSRFDVHVRSHNPLRPTIVRPAHVNIAALNRLYQNGVQQSQHRKSWAAGERRKILQGQERLCTFRPEISAYAQKLERPRELSPENRFRTEMDCREEGLALRRAKAEADELKECTFRPLTLSAAKVEPGSYIRRKDRHTLLFEEAGARHEVRQRMAELMEVEAAALAKKAHLFGDEERAMISRLSRPSERRVSESKVQFEPTINPLSERLVADARSRDPSPQSVVERLFYNQQARAIVDPAVVVHAFSPQLNPKSQDIVLSKRIKHLTNVFLKLSGGSVDPQSVTQIARAAIDLFSLTEADELVSILREATSPSISLDAFIDVCLQPKFDSMAVVHAPSRNSDDRIRAKSANPKNNNRFEEATYKPRLNPNSERIVQERKPSSRRPLKVSEKEYPYAPTINEVPAYIIALRKNASSPVKLRPLEEPVPSPDAHLQADSESQGHAVATSYSPHADAYTEVEIAERYGYSSSLASCAYRSPSPTKDSGQSVADPYPSDEAMLELLMRRRRCAP